ncbi:MAG TPA: SseB family protein [Moraxellaceae bacterium]|nr:SseB family protein [Moraxellaceae bacterium]
MGAITYCVVRMTVPRFDPLNDLEVALAAAKAGTGTVDALIDRLQSSQIFLLLDRDPGPERARDDSALPLTLNNAQGQPVLAMFSAPERSISMTVAYPQFAFGIWVEFRWLLRLVSPGVGLVLNPGAVAGFEMPAEGVLSLQTELGINS